MNRFLLWLCLLPAGLWRSFGADIDQLRAILLAKLTMDNRRPLKMGKPRKKETNNASSLGAFMSLVSGAFYLFLLFAFPGDRLLGLFAYYSGFGVMLVFTLLTDFSQVLIDTRDRHILLPRPVNDRTLLLARLLHIFAYLFRTVLPMALPGWIALTITNGLAGALWFPVPLLLLVVLVLGVVNALYILLLRLTSPERFKEVLNYFQVAFSALVFAFYYLLPRVTESALLRSFDPMAHLGLRWVPTYWLAATWSWVGLKAVLPLTALFGGLAVAVPLVLLWLLVRVLAPEFNRRLSGLDAAERTEGATTQKIRKQRKGRKNHWGDLLARTPEARAGYRLAWVQTGRSRTFRMRVLPTFAYVPVYFVYLLSSSRGSFAQTWQDLAQTKKHLLLLYMTSFVLLQALSYITISDQFKAAWVYRAAPVAKPGRIMSGAFAAVWTKFFLPFFLVVATFVLVRWGAPAILDVVLALANVTLFGLLSVRLGFRHLPFSMPEQLSNTGAKTFVRVLLVFLVPSILGAAHYLAGYFWWLKALFLVLSGVLLWLVADSYAGTSWEKLDRTEE